MKRLIRQHYNYTPFVIFYNAYAFTTLCVVVINMYALLFLRKQFIHYNGSIEKNALTLINYTHTFYFRCLRSLFGEVAFQFLRKRSNFKHTRLTFLRKRWNLLRIDSFFKTMLKYVLCTLKLEILTISCVWLMLT